MANLSSVDNEYTGSDRIVIESRCLHQTRASWTDECLNTKINIWRYLGVKLDSIAKQSGRSLSYLIRAIEAFLVLRLLQQFLNESKCWTLAYVGLLLLLLKHWLTGNLSPLALFVAIAAWLVRRGLTAPKLGNCWIWWPGVQPSFRVTYKTNIL
jgi:hypothetical protein